MRTYDKALPPDPLSTRRSRPKRPAPARVHGKRPKKSPYEQAVTYEDDSDDVDTSAERINSLQKENEALRSQLATLNKRLALLQDQCNHNRETVAAQSRRIRVQDDQVAKVAGAVKEAFQGYQDAMRRLRLETPVSPTTSSSGSEEIQVHSTFSLSDSESEYSES